MLWANTGRRGVLYSPTRPRMASSHRQRWPLSGAGGMELGYALAIGPSELLHYLVAWATPVVLCSSDRGNAIHPGNRPVGWQTPLNRARIVNTEGSISADTGGEYQR